MSLEFMKYPHLERFGNLEVTGIEHGITYVFPKIDGTNASMWFDEAKGFCYGSRNRELSLGADNAGFMATLDNTPYGTGYKRFLRKYPNLRLYGEWLVPHTLKNYRDDAWRRFYVFDVFDIDKQQYMLPKERQEFCNLLNIPHVPVVDKAFTMITNIDRLLDMSEGDGMNVDVKREGLVFKHNASDFSFKAISNSYLLKEK